MDKENIPSKLKKFKVEEKRLEIELEKYKLRERKGGFRKFPDEMKNMFVYDLRKETEEKLYKVKRRIEDFEGELYSKIVALSIDFEINCKPLKRQKIELEGIKYRGVRGKNKKAILDFEKDILEYIMKKQDTHIFQSFSSVQKETICPVCGNKEKINSMTFNLMAKYKYEDFWEKRYKENIKYLSDNNLYILKYDCCGGLWYLQSYFHNIEYENWKEYCDWLQSENKVYSLPVPNLPYKFTSYKLSPIIYDNKIKGYKLVEGWEDKLEMIRKIAYGEITNKKSDEV